MKRSHLSTTLTGALVLCCLASCETGEDLESEFDDETAREGTASGASTCIEAAENKTAVLSCPTGQTIASIVFASYGTPTGSCPNFTTGTCHAQSSLDKVKAACLNKASCSVVAGNSVFGDPCGGTPKKLAVTFSCVNPNAAKCAEGKEGSTATLSCPAGQIIASVGFASYGTPTGSCPSFSSSSCHASSSKSVVASACLNKQSCTMGANNGVFGNPCGGVAKKLAVVYTCSGSTDACPNDPNKTSPGICGCGVPEGSCTSASKCVEAAEGGTATLSCPAGQIIASVGFASYGTPTGSCPSFSSSSCHASSSMATVKSLCLNKQSCSVGANNGVFGDPCAGVGKKLAVAYTCGAGTINPGVIMPVFLLAGQSNMVGNVDKSCFDGLMYELGQGPAANLQQRLTNRLLSWYQSNNGYAMYGYSEQIAAYETSELIRLNKAGLVNATLSEPYSKVLCAYQNASPQPLALNCGGPFGLELVLGHSLGNAAYSPTSLIKVAKGGTSLYVDWLPPSAAKRNGRSVGPFYTELSQRIQSLKTNPTSVHPNCASQNCQWAGFIWFQGENDVFDAAYGQEYAQNLKNLISDVRSEIGSPALPVIIVEIGAWAQSCDSGKNVAPAQQAFVAADPYAKLVKTDDLSGFYHYDPAAQLIIGERVAKALVPMLK